MYRGCRSDSFESLPIVLRLVASIGLEALDGVTAHFDCFRRAVMPLEIVNLN